jgi:hypothetical protein
LCAFRYSSWRDLDPTMTEKSRHALASARERATDAIASTIADSRCVTALSRVADYFPLCFFATVPGGVMNGDCLAAPRFGWRCPE